MFSKRIIPSSNKLRHNFLFGKLKAMNKKQSYLLIKDLTITNGKLKAC